MKVLIADDDPVSRRRLEGALVRLGHEVVAVADGLEAMAALLSPDGARLAILDWMMPGADGLQVCHAVRQQALAYVYIILLTARGGREDMVAGLGAEADDFLTKPFDAMELGARLRSGERILELQENLLRAQETLRLQATHDPLTGLWNRATILDRLGRELHRVEREGGALAVMIADLDHFKPINDTYGHAAGDAVLRQAAERMKSTLRDCDFLGRYGGEEFLFVLPACGPAVAAHAARRVCGRIAAEPMHTDSSPLAVSVSIGVAAVRGSACEPAALIKVADEALYRAKALGRNRVEAA
jgi:two-component system cell cycle response regulator